MRLRAIASAPVLGAVLLALAFSIVWTASSTIDDPYSTLNRGWNGTSGLAARGFHPVNSLLTETISSTNATVVVLVGPNREFTRVESDSIESFIRRGGLLVIADNFGSSNGLIDLLALPVKFNGGLLVDPLFYRRQPMFPVISDLAPSEFSTGVEEILLDYATVLNVTAQDGIRLLARSSRFSFLDSNHDGAKNPGEPSGPFPVLAEVSLGLGAVVLFTSPASLANGLVDESDNSILVDNIITAAIVRYRSMGEYAILLDQTHLETSPSTTSKLMARQLVTSVLNGGMQLSGKLGMAAIAMLVVAARYAYRKPSGEMYEKAERIHAHPPRVESVLRTHPTWDRKALEYVATGLDAAMKWRRLSNEE